MEQPRRLLSLVGGVKNVFQKMTGKVATEIDALLGNPCKYHQARLLLDTLSSSGTLSRHKRDVLQQLYDDGIVELDDIHTSIGGYLTKTVSTLCEYLYLGLLAYKEPLSQEEFQDFLQKELSLQEQQFFIYAIKNDMIAQDRVSKIFSGYEKILKKLQETHAEVTIDIIRGNLLSFHV